MPSVMERLRRRRGGGPSPFRVPVRVLGFGLGPAAHGAALRACGRHPTLSAHPPTHSHSPNLHPLPQALVQPGLRRL